MYFILVFFFCHIFIKPFVTGTLGLLCQQLCQSSVVSFYLDNSQHLQKQHPDFCLT